MFFKEDIYNLILILSLMIILVVINHLLNRVYNRYDKINCSLDKSGEQLCHEYGKSKGIKQIDVMPSTNLPEFDLYSVKRDSVFLNTRCFFTKTISANVQTIELMAFHYIYLQHYRWYKFSFIFEAIFTFIGVGGWGTLFIGILMQSIPFWILGVSLIAINMIYVMISFFFVKKRYQVAYEYLIKTVSEEEKTIIAQIIRFDLINYMFKSFLGIVKIFGFMLPRNQKKNSLAKYQTTKK